MPSTPSLTFSMTDLPVINRPIDNTAMSAYMTCPREFKLAILDGWRPKVKHQALNFGSFWHRLLETHYKSGGDKDAVAETFTKYQHEVPNTGSDYRTAQRALIEYERYRKEYPPTIDCRDTVGFPDNPMVEISTAVYNETIGHEYAGKIDRIIVVDGLGYIEDHKTTSRLDKHYFKQYENSNQMMGYVWVANQIVPDIKIAGVRINAAHILKSKSNFIRHIVTYSDSRIKEWERNTAVWMQRMKDSITNDEFPAHFGNNGCRRMFGRCKFFDVCGTSEVIRQKVLEQEFVVDHWDPLALDDD